VKSRSWLVVLGLGTAAVVVAAVLLAVVRLASATSRLPERGRFAESPSGCPRPVEVVLDGTGVPHVNATRESALWFAQGYIHARDRFFQMELARRAASGRLAELFGAAVLAQDRAARTWRLDTVARRQSVQLPPDAHDALVAYSRGVNAALERYGRRIAPEIWLLESSPEPWRLEDTLSIAVLMQISMSRAMGRELERAVVLTRFGEERAVDLWGWSPHEAREWIPAGEPATAPPRAEEPIVPARHLGGSNAWAAGPARTSTGRPLLANDPHLGPRMPGPWYAMGLRCPGLHAAGLTVPGLPGVVIGHNERVAWGLTLAMIDDEDLFVVTLDKTGGKELVDGAWQPLRTVAESIEVRWQEEPELLKIRLSERGPLVRDTRREALALAWTGFDGPSPVQAILRMDRMTSVRDLAASWEGVISPAVAAVAADVDGHVLRQYLGAAPRRGRGAGRLPAPGAESRWAWRGFEPLAESLRELDPPSGIVVAANQDPFAEGELPAGLAVPGEYDPPWRARRIRETLASGFDWTVPSFAKLQGDVRSDLAVAMIKSLRGELDEHPGLAVSQLAGWDGQMRADGVPPHVFDQLLLDMEAAIGGDEAAEHGLTLSPFTADDVLRLLVGGMDESWWDDVRTPRRENRKEILAGVLAGLEAGRIRRTWGEVHQVQFEHPFGRIPVLGSMLGRAWGRGPFAAGGDSATVNATAWSREAPFGVVTLPSARLIMDVGNWDASLVMTAPGQSGRPWSRHYADQIRAWEALTAAPLPFSEAAVSEAAVARLILRPEAGAGDGGPELRSRAGAEPHPSP